jgi:hypothetical protein
MNDSQVELISEGVFTVSIFSSFAVPDKHQSATFQHKNSGSNNSSHKAVALKVNGKQS